MHAFVVSRARMEEQQARLNSFISFDFQYRLTNLAHSVLPGLGELLDSPPVFPNVLSRQMVSGSVKPFGQLVSRPDCLQAPSTPLRLLIDECLAEHRSTVE